MIDYNWTVKPEVGHQVNSEFTDALDCYACNANMAHVFGQSQQCSNFLVQLYNLVHGMNSHRLLSMDANNGQSIGLAFTKMALFFSNGNKTVNEIAAQNAYYCLAKNIIVCKNTFAAAPLFSIIFRKPRLLGDEFRALVERPMMAFEDPSRRYYEGLECAFPLLRYILTFFYDSNKRAFTIDTTLPYHLPSQQEVDKLFELLRQKGMTNDKEVIETGKKFFVKVFNRIVETLERF